MSDSDDDSSGYMPYTLRRTTYPLHDAAEVGDTAALATLLASIDGKSRPLQGGDEAEEAAAPPGVAEGDGVVMKEVEEPKAKAEDGEGADGDGEVQPKGQEEEEAGQGDKDEEDEEEGEEDEGEDESYHGPEEEEEDDEDGMDEDEDGDDAGGQEDRAEAVVAVTMDTSDADEGPDDTAGVTHQRNVFPPLDINEEDNFRCTPLHVALHARQFESVRLLVEAGASLRKKVEGSTPLHAALAVGSLPAHRDFCIEVVRLMLHHDVDVTEKDDCGHSPLHIAAFHGLLDVVKLLLACGGEATLNDGDRGRNRPVNLAAKQGHADVVDVLVKAGADLSLTNIVGSTALHVAAARGRWDVVRVLLGGDEATARALSGLRDKQGRTAAELVVIRGGAVPEDVRALLGMEEAVAPADGDEGPRSTVIFMDPRCSRHFTCTPIERTMRFEPPPENVNRVKVLIDDETGILHAGEFADCEWVNEAPRAEMGDLLKVHDYGHLEKVRQKCEELPDNEYAIAHLDGDTAISADSWEAALRAAGATCAAVDRVVTGKNRNAFCAVRPPGHHAGSRGVVKAHADDAGSYGFCLINNIAVAAAYARNVYRHQGVNRIALVDIDVHFGNGTDEIVRNLVPREEVESHEFSDSTVRLSSLRFKPWLKSSDANEVLFVSVHGYGGRSLTGQGTFYPGSGDTHIPEIDEATTSASVVEPSIPTEPLVLNIGLPLVNARLEAPGTSRMEWRAKMRDHVLPSLVKFRPDLILVSAGFDAHKKDTINMGYIGLIEEDYEWVTRQLVRVANTCCDGRLVSVLEGGYRINGGLTSYFARSVAAHVRALVEGAESREGYSEDDVAWERKFELRLHAKRMNIMKKSFIAAKREEVNDEVAALKEEEAEAANGQIPGVPANGQIPGVPGVDAAAESTSDAVAAPAPADDAPAPATDAAAEASVGSRRPKRKAASNIDWVALDKKMKAEAAPAQQEEV